MWEGRDTVLKLGIVELSKIRSDLEVILEKIRQDDDVRLSYQTTSFLSQVILNINGLLSERRRRNEAR